MIKALSRVLLLLLIAGTFLACSDKAKDLDKVCQAFTQLSRHPKLATLSHSERLAFVNQRVSDELSRFSQVTPLWEHVSYYESSASYRMFRRTAEELLGESWTCQDMERLAPTLSEPVVESH
jgi:hypothetical protein